MLIVKFYQRDHKKIINEGKLNFQIVKRSKKNGKDLVSDYSVIKEVIEKLRKKNYFFEIVIYFTAHITNQKSRTFEKIIKYFDKT